MRFDKNFQPTVSPIQEDEIHLDANEVGLVLWTENGGERWQAFRGVWKRPANSASTEPVWITPNSRGPHGENASPDAVAQLTAQLDPLLCPSVVKALPQAKATGFLTPPDGGWILGTRLTIRRPIGETRGPPPASAELVGGNTRLKIDLSQNNEVWRLDQAANLPAEWKSGLPPGPYSLQLDGYPATQFNVESPARREQIVQWLKDWRQTTEESSSASDALVACEYLASQQPHPLLADALDALDDLESKLRTPFLRQRRQDIVDLLQVGKESDAEKVTGDSTGIPAIDRARRSIARGKWEEALHQLNSISDAADGRSRALADLYRGVIHAESGLGQEPAAEFFFRRAIAGLNQGSAADRVRAHNNYANFLLNRSQDRLFNQAFQMAAGVRRLFTTAAMSWEEARIEYEAALASANALGPAERATVQVNLARLYATLADFLSTLEPVETGSSLLDPAEKAARRTAEEFAKAAAKEVHANDSFIVPVTETILAQLAFRARDATVCRDHAQRALEGYANCGSLAGIEATERLLGMLALRAPQFSAAKLPDVEARRTALSHFRRSQLLSELLRGQMPVDRVGLTRAGFFARRIYVLEQIVELLIAEGKAADALRYVELAKARSLQDLLTTESIANSATLEPAETLADILQHWPPKLMALEYFLTADRAWVFVVADGTVEVFPLVDDAGQPVAARQLVAQVRDVLRVDLDRYAAKMQKRVLEGHGLDHTWQVRLHDLQKRLLPAAVLTRLAKTPTLLIVPHHILHYFPFAALVTQVDATHDNPLEMVQPRFLIDEGCDICYAPSLVVWGDLRRRSVPTLSEAAAIGIGQLPAMEPLPGVSQELTALRTALGSRLKLVVTDEDAHLQNALSMLRQPGFLLIGTHGQNWPDRPLSSELLLYPHGGDSGRLTAGQLFTCEVKRDLVVLSACYTALADKSPLPGDDLFGLQRALLQSGGRTVIAGQWDIYDRSGPELMRELFTQLGEGKPAYQALALSQRQFLARLRASTEPEPWLHPYFWAVFTVCGDDRTAFASRP